MIKDEPKWVTEYNLNPKTMTPLEKVKKLIEIKNEAYAQGVMDAYLIFSNGSEEDIGEMKKIFKRLGYPCTNDLTIDETREAMHRVKLRENKLR